MDEVDRDAVVALRTCFEALGADNPERRAVSEITENIPQLARFLALRSVWPELIGVWVAPGSLETIPAANRLLSNGAYRDDLAQLVRSTTYDAIFGLLYRLTTHGRDDEAPDDSPGWRLMETTATGELTGRAVQSLHESLLSMDPSGRDGQDLFD
ncbi:hypothetical protein [Nonomuraea sp. NPDC049028]|uniref:hypothetical protein n=1 Tax=Nonomuraea sp. NPDC049028 TaxID=3364348 RepID=UPI00371809E8